MFHETPTPRLIQLYFGEHAETAWMIATDRLRKWCLAFDEWLARYQPGRSRNNPVAVWQRFINDRHQMPWMVSKVDIELHAAWMQSTGYTRKTISYSHRYISAFYRWCAEKQVDPECGAKFNPAAEVKLTRVRSYEGSKLMSREEIEALLGVLQQDQTPLGKREYAFTLTRLRVGVPLNSLQRLQWKNISRGEGEVRVLWKTGTKWLPLPGEIWEAIQNYLRASGRLEGMQADEYVFCPQVTNGPELPLDRREAWSGGRYLSNSQMSRNLKVYGRAAFIDEEKLNLEFMRQTAIRLKLNEGASLEEMQVFLNTNYEKPKLKYKLKQIPDLPEDKGIPAGSGQEAPHRLGGRPPGDIQHGLYAKNLPEEDVQAVLDENVEGIDEELVCMRRLARGLITAQKMTTDPEDQALLLDGYTMAATRVAGLIDAEREMAETPSEPPWLEGFLKMFDGVRKQGGEEPLSGRLREMFQGAGYEPSETDRMLEEEIAAARYVQRNTYTLAVQTLEGGNLRRYAHLVTLYGRGCSRLISLLKKRVSRGSVLADFVWETWEGAKTIWLESKGWGGDDPINNPQPPVDYVDGEVIE